MIRRRRRFIALAKVAVGVLILFAAGCALTAWVSPDNLFPRAEKLIDLEAISGEHEYFWLSDHEVLVLRPDETSSDESQFELRAYNVQSGASRPYLRLDAAASGLIERGSEYGRISPDRRWIVWQVDGANPVLVGLSLRDSEVVKWSAPNSILWMEWMPDSERFVVSEDIGGVTHAVVRSIRAPGQMCELPEKSVDQVIPNGHEIISVSWPHEAGKFRGTGYGSAYRLEGLKIVGTRPVGLTPPRGQDPQCWWRLSPTGDRLLWMNIIGLYRESALRKLFRLFNNDARSDIVTELWISKSDGTEMREIGYLPRPPTDGQGQPVPIAFEWLPDGRSISFIWGHNLWRLPVD